MCYCYNSYFIVILGSFFLLSLLISLKSTHPSCCHLGVYFQSQEMIFEGLGEKKIHPFWYFYLKFYLFSVIQRKLFYLTFGGKKDFRKGEGKNYFALDFRRCRRWLSSEDLQVYQEEQRLSGIYDNLQFAKVVQINDRLVKSLFKKSLFQ